MAGDLKEVVGSLTAVRGSFMVSRAKVDVNYSVGGVATVTILAGGSETHGFVRVC